MVEKAKIERNGRSLEQNGAAKPQALHTGSNKSKNQHNGSMKGAFKCCPKRCLAAVQPQTTTPTAARTAA